MWNRFAGITCSSRFKISVISPVSTSDWNVHKHCYKDRYISMTRAKCQANNIPDWNVHKHCYKDRYISMTRAKCQANNIPVSYCSAAQIAILESASRRHLYVVVLVIPSSQETPLCCCLSHTIIIMIQSVLNQGTGERCSAGD
jgi:hypothetical protein